MRSTGIQQRQYSIIQRRMMAGRPVYVKKHLTRLSLQTPEQVRAQLTREVTILNRLSVLPGLTGSLGVMKVVDGDISNAQLVTEEVAGEPLEKTLRSANRRTWRGTCTRALYLAGRWLRVFQTLPIDDGTPNSSVNRPQELAAYCDVRLTMLIKLGYHWPSAATRQLVLRWLEHRMESTPEEQRGKTHCHGDYGPFNLMWDGRVLTPIDFGSCGRGMPLADITYLIHCLELLPIETPWRRWPVDLWKRACLRGYGVPDAERSPVYDALMVQHFISRLKKNLQTSPTGKCQRLHNLWCRTRLVRKLERLIRRPCPSANCVGPMKDFLTTI